MLKKNKQITKQNQMPFSVFQPSQNRFTVANAKN